MKQNWLGKVTLAIMSVAFVFTGVQPVEAKASADEWRAIAERAIVLYGQGGTALNEAFTRGQALSAIGTLYGWQDSRIQPLITRLGQLRNPDGGWGINRAWDAMGDGTVNPANTSYTVTMTDHVGVPLIKAYKGGAISNTVWIQQIIALLKSSPRIDTAAGACIAYSRNANDAKAGWCVHNVNAGVAAFFQYAISQGFGGSGIQALIVSILRREISAYNITHAGWTYSDAAGSIQDPDHGAYSARSIQQLAYPMGREAAYRIMTSSTTGDDAVRARMQIVGMPGGIGSGSTTHTTLWCQLGDAYLDDAADYVEAAVGDQMRLAQAANAAADAWLACQ